MKEGDIGREKGAERSRSPSESICVVEASANKIKCNILSRSLYFYYIFSFLTDFYRLTLFVFLFQTLSHHHCYPSSPFTPFDCFAHWHELPYIFFFTSTPSSLVSRSSLVSYTGIPSDARFVQFYVSLVSPSARLLLIAHVFYAYHAATTPSSSLDWHASISIPLHSSLTLFCVLALTALLQPPYLTRLRSCSMCPVQKDRLYPQSRKSPRQSNTVSRQ